MPHASTKPKSLRAPSRPPQPPRAPLRHFRNDPRNGFEVRTFAGSTAYADSLSHVRVAHVTDMHVGRVTPMSVQRAAVDLVNRGRPDMVMITGDFVCHSTRYLDELTSIVRAFDAPVFGVMGNHDYWSGAAEVRAALRRGGVEILDNANTTITVRHQALQVVGLDDAYTGHADRARALKGLRRDVPVIGLSHIAEEADALWARGVPLVLAGHTHAGQVTVARLHEFMIGKLAGHKYVHGLYGSRRAAGGAVYVGAGVGAAVVPLRIGDRGRREIAFFELGHEPGSFAEHHDEQPALAGRKPSAKLAARRAARAKRVDARRSK